MTVIIDLIILGVVWNIIINLNNAIYNAKKENEKWTKVYKELSDK